MVKGEELLRQTGSWRLEQIPVDTVPRRGPKGYHIPKGLTFLKWVNFGKINELQVTNPSMKRLAYPNSRDGSWGRFTSGWRIRKVNLRPNVLNPNLDIKLG